MFQELWLSFPCMYSLEISPQHVMETPDTISILPENFTYLDSVSSLTDFSVTLLFNIPGNTRRNFSYLYTFWSLYILPIFLLWLSFSISSIDSYTYLNNFRVMEVCRDLWRLIRRPEFPDLGDHSFWKTFLVKNEEKNLNRYLKRSDMSNEKDQRWF